MASRQKEKKTVRGTLVDDRGIWVVRARVYDPATGKTRQRTKSTGFKVKDSTKRKAELAMRGIVAKWENEANSEVIKNDPLFKEYVEKFLVKKETSRRANTAKSYRDYARVHILPALGNMRIRDMRLSDLQDYFRIKLETLSVVSLRKHLVVISGALLDAARDGIIKSNFAKDVELPTAKKFEGKSYNAEQVGKLLEGAKSAGEPLQAAVILGAIYGLRREEICGLRWQDVDFEAGQIYIRHTLTQNGALILETDDTKTNSSRRTIAFVPGTEDYFRTLKQKHIAAGLTLDKVCVWPDGREVRPNYLTHAVPKLMKNCGLPKIRLHDLRHTAASLLATKAKPKQVQGFLGHEDISTTMGLYAHLLDRDRQETSTIMREVLGQSVLESVLEPIERPEEV